MIATTQGRRLFGNAVREARQELGLSAEDLAFELGIEASYLRVMEAGGITPRSKHFNRICELLGLDGAGYFEDLRVKKSFEDLRAKKRFEDLRAKKRFEGKEINKITLEQLRSFCAVAETRSFDTAARSAGRMLSTISTQMQDLERIYGVQLINRHPRLDQERLTDAGKVVYKAARRIFEALKGAETALEHYGVDGNRKE